MGGFLVDIALILVIDLCNVILDMINVCDYLDIVYFQCISDHGDSLMY